MIKTIHLLFATLLLGINIISYLMCLKQYPHPVLRRQTLAISLRLDWIIISILGVLFLTGTLIVPTYHWAYTTPWIKAAYLLLSLTTILWLINALLKNSLKIAPSNTNKCFFHLISLTIAVILVLVIKDAVTKHTWIPL